VRRARATASVRLVAPSLPQDVADMLLDGVEGDYELPGDDLIRPARSQHLQHFQLAAGQRLNDAWYGGGTSSGIWHGVPGVECALEPGQAAKRDASPSAVSLSRWPVGLLSGTDAACFGLGRVSVPSAGRGLLTAGGARLRVRSAGFCRWLRERVSSWRG
jgi:hypothetical protein